MPNLIVAVAYIRMSSSRQDKSPEQQRAEIIRFARQRGYRIIRWYQDDGRSGGKATDKRIGFMKMISDAETLGDFAAVLTWDKKRLDRLDTLEGAEYKRRLRDAGVYLDTVTEGQYDWSTQDGQLKDAFASVQGNQYLISLSREVIRGKVSAFSDGRPLGGQPPYGMARLITDEKGTQHLVGRGEHFRTLKGWKVDYVAGDAGELETLKWMFETFDTQDVSPHWIASELNRREIPSPFGGLWRVTTVRKTLTRETYIGNAVGGKVRQKETFHRMTPDGAKRNRGPGGKLAKTSVGTESEVLRDDGRYEPVIDPVLFFRVGEKLAANKRNGRKPRAEDAGYPLSGILHCGHCGSRMFGQTKTLKRGTFVRYHCGRFMNNPGCECKGWKVDEPEVIGQAIAKLREVVSPKRIAELTVRKSNGPDPTAEAEKRLAKIDAAINRGNRRICDIEDDRAAKGVLSELERLYAERDRIAADLRLFDDPEIVPKKVLGWMDDNRLTLQNWQLASLSGLLDLIEQNGHPVYRITPGTGKMPGEIELLDPLELRRLFLEIGLRLDCYWVEAPRRTRAGKYLLERIEVSVNLEELVSDTPFDQKQSVLR